MTVWLKHPGEADTLGVLRPSLPITACMVSRG